MSDSPPPDRRSVLEADLHDEAPLVGTSPAVRRLRVDIAIAARSDAKVLITGETGVGKDVTARLLHRMSVRAARRFVALNCASLPDSLLESELFGHTRGSFTGAYRDKPGLAMAAHGGTLFLDEVGEMSSRLQALVLRFAESGEVRRIGATRSDGSSDARIVAATNRDLAARVASGDFRRDLYYRLNVIPIAVPPLRDRREDLLPLIEHFLARGAARHQIPVPELTPEVRTALLDHAWPGNVRELLNVAERILARPHQHPVTVDDIAEGLEAPPAPPAAPADGPAAQPPRTAAEAAWHQMVADGVSFWEAVHDVFLDRELTKTDVRALVSRGLRQTRGSYRALASLFHVPSTEYRRFLAFLYEHDCHIAASVMRHALRREERQAREA